MSDKLDKSTDELIDRENGILSKTDREYLLGEKDIEANTSHERITRSRIRTRIEEAFVDMQIIAEEFEERDIDKIEEDMTQEDAQYMVNFFERFADSATGDLQSFISSMVEKEIKSQMNQFDIVISSEEGE